MADSCATCFFFSTQPVQDTISGLNRTVPVCRRNAPDAPPVAASMQKALWPQVDGTDWCGDFLTVYPNAAGTWTTWAPSVASSTGTITSLSTNYARFTQLGKLILVNLEIDITTNGTGSLNVAFSLPVAAKNRSAVFYGKELVTGKTLMGLFFAAGLVGMTFYDGTYPGADGAELVIGGAYEIA